MSDQTPVKKTNNEKKPRKKRPFLRFIKRLFVFFFIIILLVAGAFGVAYFTVDPQILVTKASQVLKEKYNREIEVSSVKLSLIKGIALEGIDLSYRGGFSKGSALNLKEASILYNPVALLWGELDIIKIRVAGFYTTYENIMAIAKDFSQDGADKPAPAQPEKPKGPGIFRLKMRAIEIDDAQFVYNNIPLNFKALINPRPDFNLSQIKAEIFSMYGKIDIDGTLDKLNLHITDLKADKFSSGIKNVKVNNALLTLIKENENRYTVIGKSVDVDAMGYHISTYTRFEGSYGIKGQTVLIRNFGVKVNQAQLYLDRLSYFVKNQQLSVNITNISAQISDFVPGIKGSVTGKLDIEKAKDTYITGELIVEDFRYKFIRDGQLRLKLKDNALNGTVDVDTSGGKMLLSARSENVLTAATTLTLDSDKFDLYPVMLNLQTDKGAKESPADTNAVSGKSSGPAMKLPPIIFKGKVDRLSFKDYTLDDVNLTAVYRRGDLELENFSLGFIGGILQGSGTLAGNFFSGEVSYKDGNLRKFSEKYLKGGKKLYGRINASSKFRLNIASPLNSIMQFDLDMTGGEIINFVLMEEINKLLYFIPAENIQYDRIQTALQMRDGILEIKSLDFMSTDLKMMTKGSVDLEKKTQDVNLTVSIHERYLEGAALVSKPFIPGKQGDHYINRIHITGSFEKPRMALNPK